MTAVLAVGLGAMNARAYEPDPDCSGPSGCSILVLNLAGTVCLADTKGIEGPTSLNYTFESGEPPVTFWFDHAADFPYPPPCCAPDPDWGDCSLLEGTQWSKSPSTGVSISPWDDWGADVTFSSSGSWMISGQFAGWSCSGGLCSGQPDIVAGCGASISVTMGYPGLPPTVTPTSTITPTPTPTPTPTITPTPTPACEPENPKISFTSSYTLPVGFKTGLNMLLSLAPGDIGQLSAEVSGTVEKEDCCTSGYQLIEYGKITESGNFSVEISASGPVSYAGGQVVLDIDEWPQLDFSLTVQAGVFWDFSTSVNINGSYTDNRCLDDVIYEGSINNSFSAGLRFTLCCKWCFGDSMPENCNEISVNPLSASLAGSINLTWTHDSLGNKVVGSLNFDGAEVRAYVVLTSYAQLNMRMFGIEPRSFPLASSYF
ncbi:MAG: hypothetical protein GC154_03745 [bacterium]|nr:hypothetical protein [bacterium]